MLAEIVNFVLFTWLGFFFAVPLFKLFYMKKERCLLEDWPSFIEYCQTGKHRNV